MIEVQAVLAFIAFFNQHIVVIFGFFEGKLLDSYLCYVGGCIDGGARYAMRHRFVFIVGLASRGIAIIRLIEGIAELAAPLLAASEILIEINVLVGTDGICSGIIAFAYDDNVMRDDVIVCAIIIYLTIYDTYRLVSNGNRIVSHGIVIITHLDALRVNGIGSPAHVHGPAVPRARHFVAHTLNGDHFAIGRRRKDRIRLVAVGEVHLTVEVVGVHTAVCIIS